MPTPRLWHPEPNNGRPTGIEVPLFNPALDPLRVRVHPRESRARVLYCFVPLGAPADVGYGDLCTVPLNHDAGAPGEVEVAEFDEGARGGSGGEGEVEVVEVGGTEGGGGDGTTGDVGVF